MMSFGIKSVELSGDRLPPTTQTLWAQEGWKEIPKDEYQELAKEHRGTSARPPFAARAWIFVVVALLLLRLGKPLALLFTLATAKGKLLKGMATSYSFPPVSPSQFPTLDRAELGRYTRELESLGFVRLLDFSLLADVSSSKGCS